MRRLLLFFISTFLLSLALLFISPKQNVSHAATCAQLLPTASCINKSLAGNGECYKTAAGASDCNASTQICCQADPTCQNLGGSCFLQQCGNGNIQAPGSTSTTCNANGNYVCCKTNGCTKSSDCPTGYTCSIPAGNPTFGGTCVISSPQPGPSCTSCPQNNNYQKVELLNTPSTSGWFGPPQNCPEDPANPGNTYAQICYYQNPQAGFSGNSSKCIKPTTTTCQTNQTCSTTAGCIASGSPNPSTCKFATGIPQTCTSDTQCNTAAGAACSDFHCIDSTGFIYTPENGTSGNNPTCQYKPDATVRPGSEQTACLICSSGCTQTDSNGNAFCVATCSSGTKVSPKSTQFCDAYNEVCVQGKGCVAADPNCNIKNGCEPTGVYGFKCGFDPKNPNKPTCETAIGPIDADVGGFINSIFLKVLGIIGGLAVLLIIISGYRFMGSQGNPEKVQQAREQLTAAIIGLLFVIFSLVILQVIGYDILKLPGFAP